MTDDWLRVIDDKKIVGAVLLDFIVDFDIIDQSAAGKTYVLWLQQTMIDNFESQTEV